MLKARPWVNRKASGVIVRWIGSRVQPRLPPNVSARFPPHAVLFGRNVDPETFPLVVIPNFVGEAAQAALLADVEPQLRRRRYEPDHWDSVISQYREVQLPIAKLSVESRRIVQRVYDIFPEQTVPMRTVHALDLAPEGEIRNHVDSIKFSGEIVCGISLLSDGVMRLKREPVEDAVREAAVPHKPQAIPYGCKCKPALPGADLEDGVDILLKRGSLYMLYSDSRYKYGHAVLGPASGLQRGRRISIILRDELVQAPTSLSSTPMPASGSLAEAAAAPIASPGRYASVSSGTVAAEEGKDHGHVHVSRGHER